MSSYYWTLIVLKLNVLYIYVPVWVTYTCAEPKEKLKDKHIICYVVSFMKPKYGTEKLRFSNILCLNDVSSSQ